MGEEGTPLSIMLYGDEGEQIKLTRLAGWDGFSANRVMQDGRVLEYELAAKDESVVCEYVAEDEKGKTAFVLLADSSAPLRRPVREHFASILNNRVGMLKEVVIICFLAADELAGIEDRLARGKLPLKTRRDFERAHRSVVQARRALERAAASIGSLEVYNEAIKKEPPPDTDPPGENAESEQLSLYDLLRSIGERLQKRIRDFTAFTSGDFTIDQYSDVVTSFTENLAIFGEKIGVAIERMRKELPKAEAKPLIKELQDAVEILERSAAP
jgi:hypothetical protein